MPFLPGPGVAGKIGRPSPWNVRGNWRPALPNQRAAVKARATRRALSCDAMQAAPSKRNGQRAVAGYSWAAMGFTRVWLQSPLRPHRFENSRGKSLPRSVPHFTELMQGRQTRPVRWGRYQGAQ